MCACVPNLPQTNRFCILIAPHWAEKFESLRWNVTDTMECIFIIILSAFDSFVLLFFGFIFGFAFIFCPICYCFTDLIEYIRRICISMYHVVAFIRKLNSGITNRLWKAAGKNALRTIITEYSKSLIVSVNFFIVWQRHVFVYHLYADFCSSLICRANQRNTWSVYSCSPSTITLQMQFYAVASI